MDIISQYSFAPTPLSRENLIREGKKESSIYVTGNTVIDGIYKAFTELLENEEPYKKMAGAVNP